MIFKQCKGHRKRKKKRKAAFKICIKHQPCLPFIWKLSNAPSCFHFWHLVSKKENEPPYRINEVCIALYFFQNLAVSNLNLKWVKLHFPTYEHGWKKIFFWSSPFPESFWGSSLVSSWNLWNWNHSLLHTWPTPENFLCVFSNSWFCLWSLLHSSLVSTMSQC